MPMHPHYIPLQFSAVNNCLFAHDAVMIHACQHLYFPSEDCTKYPQSSLELDIHFWSVITHFSMHLKAVFPLLQDDSPSPESTTPSALSGSDVLSAASSELLHFKEKRITSGLDFEDSEYGWAAGSVLLLINVRTATSHGTPWSSCVQLVDFIDDFSLRGIHHRRSCLSSGKPLPAAGHVFAICCLQVLSTPAVFCSGE